MIITKKNKALTAVTAIMSHSNLYTNLYESVYLKNLTLCFTACLLSLLVNYGKSIKVETFAVKFVDKYGDAAINTAASAPQINGVAVAFCHALYPENIIINAIAKFPPVPFTIAKNTSK